MAADTATPGRDAAWTHHVERAHALSHAAANRLEEQPSPAVDLAPVLASIERGLGAMYDALDERDDPATSLSRAHGRLWDAAIGAAHGGSLEELATLRDACASLIEAERLAPAAAAPGAPRAPGAARDDIRGGSRDSARNEGDSPRAGDRPGRAGGRSTLKVSHDELALHVIDRASLVPSFRAPPPPVQRVSVIAPPLPVPTTFEELTAAAAKLRAIAEAQRAALTEALRRPPSPSRKGAVPAHVEPPPGFAEVPPPPISEDDLLRKWARECFEEIGMLGVQRAPLPGEDWRAARVLEARMLASVDALASLGPTAIAHVERLAMDAPTPDPLRIFAATLIAGCTAGRDALAIAERVLLRFGPGDPVVASAFTSAVKLAPHPLLPRMLRGLAASAPSRFVALDLLAARGWLSAAELPALAADGDARVRALALRAMGALRHPDLDRLAETAAGDVDTSVQAALLDALLLAASARAARTARAAAAGPLGNGALIALAIAGGEGDAAWLLDRARERPTAEAIDALGWAGSLAAVPWLLERLPARDDDLAGAAARALDRLLGARLVDRVEVMPEALEKLDVIDPDPEPRPARRSLTELIDDARDPSPAGSSETLEVTSTNVERWQAHWEEHRSALDPKLRWRRGQPLGAAVVLQELDRLPLSKTERIHLWHELAYRTGKYARFSPDDLVATQEKSLLAWAEIVRETREVAGDW